MLNNNDIENWTAEIDDLAGRLEWATRGSSPGALGAAAVVLARIRLQEARMWLQEAQAQLPDWDDEDQ